MEIIPHAKWADAKGVEAGSDLSNMAMNVSRVRTMDAIRCQSGLLAKPTLKNTLLAEASSPSRAL